MLRESLLALSLCVCVCASCRYLTRSFVLNIAASRAFEADSVDLKVKALRSKVGNLYFLANIVRF